MCRARGDLPIEHENVAGNPWERFVTLAQGLHASPGNHTQHSVRALLRHLDRADSTTIDAALGDSAHHVPRTEDERGKRHGRRGDAGAR